MQGIIVENSGAGINSKIYIITTTVCYVCIVGILECIPLSAVYGLDDLYQSNGSSSTYKFGQLKQEAGQLELKRPQKWSRVVPRTNATNNRFNEREVPGSLMNATNKQAR